MWARMAECAFVACVGVFVVGQSDLLLLSFLRKVSNTANAWSPPSYEFPPIRLALATKERSHTQD